MRGPSGSLYLRDVLASERMVTFIEPGLVNPCEVADPRIPIQLVKRRFIKRTAFTSFISVEMRVLIPTRIEFAPLVMQDYVQGVLIAKKYMLAMGLKAFVDLLGNILFSPLSNVDDKHARVEYPRMRVHAEFAVVGDWRARSELRVFQWSVGVHDGRINVRRRSLLRRENGMIAEWFIPEEP